MRSIKFRVELDLVFRRSGYNDTPPEDLEPDYTLAEIDAFMKEPLYLDMTKNDGSKLSRYYFYTQSITSFISSFYKSEDKVYNIKYEDGGKLSFIFELYGKKLEQRAFDLADDFMEKSFGNPDGWSPYEGGIGNEFVVSSRKMYRSMQWEESSDEEEKEDDEDDEEKEEGDYQALGIVDFREDNHIRVFRLD